MQSLLHTDFKMNTSFLLLPNLSLFIDSLGQTNNLWSYDIRFLTDVAILPDTTNISIETWWYIFLQFFIFSLKMWNFNNTDI